MQRHGIEQHAWDVRLGSDLDAIHGPRESSADAAQDVGDRSGLLPGLVTAMLELRLPEEVADEALQENRRYSQPFGLAEALIVDVEGAWIGIDNNNGARADGEKRPIVWRFAAPEGGWSAKS